jgi:hypothetical protein
VQLAVGAMGKELRERRSYFPLSNHPSCLPALIPIELIITQPLLSPRGQTPLHFAANARSRTKEICQLLLSHGAAKDIMDASGRVPYEMADQDDVRKMLGGPDGR